MREVGVLARRIHSTMELLAPRSNEDVPTGPQGEGRPHLADSIELRFSRSGLTARVGFITKRVTSLLFFARFQEFGYRHYRAGDEIGSPSGEFIRNPFMQPAYELHQRQGRAKIRKAVQEASRKIAAKGIGGG